MTPPRLLGELEQLVLLAVVQLENSAYAIPVLKLLEQRAGLRMARGSVYVTLDRLERKGYLESWFGDPTPERGGKSKRYFRITAQGAAALRRSRETVDRLWEGIEPALEKL